LVVRMDGCRFEPHVSIVRTNQTVRVINSELLAHNVHPSPHQHEGFGLTVDRVFERSFKRAERLPFPVCCDIHPWEKSWWLVLDHPYPTVTEKDGNFEIKTLPAGEHEFKIWHENPGYLYKDKKDPKKGLIVKIEDGKTFEVPEIKVLPT